jgi:hypothetical protein
MGLFSTRPEEPTEWAGLPSEPARDRTEAESLAAQTESADSLAFLGTTIESIVIPVAPIIEVAQPPAESAKVDPPA